MKSEWLSPEWRIMERSGFNWEIWVSAWEMAPSLRGLTESEPDGVPVIDGTNGATGLIQDSCLSSDQTDINQILKCCKDQTKICLLSAWPNTRSCLSSFSQTGLCNCPVFWEDLAVGQGLFLAANWLLILILSYSRLVKHFLYNSRNCK